MKAAKNGKIKWVDGYIKRITQPHGHAVPSDYTVQIDGRPEPKFGILSSQLRKVSGSAQNAMVRVCPPPSINQDFFEGPCNHWCSSHRRRLSVPRAKPSNFFFIAPPLLLLRTSGWDAFVGCVCGMRLLLVNMNIPNCRTPMQMRTVV